MGYIRDLIAGLPARSPKWDRFRDAHIKANPTCAACGSRTKLEAHHILPFHLRPDLELVPSNILTLCENGPNCHLTFGHLRDWKQYNPHVIEDSALYLSRLKQYRIYRKNEPILPPANGIPDTDK